MGFPAMSCGCMTGRLPSVSSILIVSRIWTDEGGERPGVTPPPRVAEKSPWDFPPRLLPSISLLPATVESCEDDPAVLGGVQFSPCSAFVLTIPFTPRTSSLNNVEGRTSPDEP